MVAIWRPFFAALHKIKPLLRGFDFLADAFYKRDSPTFCRPRFGLQAEPFESPTRSPQGLRFSPYKTKAP